MKCFHISWLLISIAEFALKHVLIITNKRTRTFFYYYYYLGGEQRNQLKFPIIINLNRKEWFLISFYQIKKPILKGFFPFQQAI